LTLQEVLSIEENEQSDYFSGRIRKVVMFPGASYQFNSMATGLRGRVLRNGEPMRWAYIEATDPVSEDLIIRTRGDDRGEFLLALPPHAARAGDLNATYDIRISIAGPSVVPVSDTPELQGLDNYWDLPIEELPPAGMPDNVASGESIPDDYVISPSAVRIVTFQVGRILTGREEADFEFSLP